MMCNTELKKLIKRLKIKYPKQPLYLYSDEYDLSVWSIHNSNVIRFDLHLNTWVSTMLSKKFIDDCTKIIE